MSSTSRNLIVVVIVVLAALGAWYWYQSIQSSWSGVGTTAGSGTDSTALPSGSDTSDQGLSEDMASIGTNIQTVDSDSAAADTSVNEASSGNAQ